MNNTVSLTVNINGIGETQMSFDITELLNKLNVEHLMYPCSENHSQAEIDSVDFVCIHCGGTGLVLHPAGQVLTKLIRREGIARGKWMLQTTREAREQKDINA